MINTCLYCKLQAEMYIIGISNNKNFVIKTLKCPRCNKSWKDFDGVNSESSPVISIQRNTSNNSNRPLRETK